MTHTKVNDVASSDSDAKNSVSNPLEAPEPTDPEGLKRHFEQNMLDGDAIQDGQMLNSMAVFEYVKELIIPSPASPPDQGTNELETALRQVHIDGYDRGKKQHETPYTYTLPNETFLKEKYKALQAHIRRVTLEAQLESLEWAEHNADDVNYSISERIKEITKELQEAEGEQNG